MNELSATTTLLKSLAQVAAPSYAQQVAGINAYATAALEQQHGYRVLRGNAQKIIDKVPDAVSHYASATARLVVANPALGKALLSHALAADRRTWLYQPNLEQLSQHYQASDLLHGIADRSPESLEASQLYRTARNAASDAQTAITQTGTQITNFIRGKVDAPHRTAVMALFMNHGQHAQTYLQETPVKATLTEVALLKMARLRAPEPYKAFLKARDVAAAGHPDFDGLMREYAGYMQAAEEHSRAYETNKAVADTNEGPHRMISDLQGKVLSEQALLGMFTSLVSVAPGLGAKVTHGLPGASGLTDGLQKLQNALDYHHGVMAVTREAEVEAGDLRGMMRLVAVLDSGPMSKKTPLQHPNGEDFAAMAHYLEGNAGRLHRYGIATQHRVALTREEVLTPTSAAQDTLGEVDLLLDIGSPASAFVRQGAMAGLHWSQQITNAIQDEVRGRLTPAPSATPTPPPAAARLRHT